MTVGQTSNDLMEILLDLDAQDAQATADKLGKGMEKLVAKAEETKTGFAKSLEKLKLVTIEVGVWGKLLEGVSSMIQRVAGVFKSLSEFMGQVVAQSNELARANMFGASAKDGERLAAILGDVKSGMEGLRMATEGRQLGLSQQDIENMAHLVNVLHAATGESKANLEARVKTASLTDRELGALSKITGQLKSQQSLQISMLEAQAKAGGRNLDQGERIQTMLRFTQASAEMSKSLASLQETNPFDHLVQQAKSFWETLTKDLTPAIRATGQALAWLGRMGVSALQGLWHGFKRFSEAVGEGAARLWVRMAQGKEAIKWVDELDIRIREQRRMQADADKARAKALQEQHAQQKRGLQDQQEAVQEVLGRMAAARAQLRNFDMSMLGALSRETAKGIGGIIGGMTAAVELAKQFVALLGPDFERRGGKAAQLMQAATRSVLSAFNQLVQAERNATAALEEQLLISNELKATRQADREEREKTKQITDAQRAIDDAITVLARSRVKQAEALRLRLVEVRREITEQTEQQIHLLRIRRDIAAIEERHQLKLKELELLKTQAQAADELRKHIVSISEIEGRIVRDRGEAARAQAQQLAIEEKRLRTEINRLEVLKLFALRDEDIDLRDRELKRERALLAITQSKRMVFEAESAARERAAQLADSQYRLEQARTSIARQAEQANLAATVAGMKATLQFRDREVESAAALRTVQAAVTEQMVSIVALQRQLTLVQPQSEKAAELRSEIDHRTRILALQRQQIALTELQIEREKEARTTWGAMVQQLQEQARGMQAKLGGELASGLLRTAQGFTSAFGQMFSDLITQPQNALGALGKAILSTFGDLAGQLAAFFAAQGLALLFMPGGQASGIGMLAAAAGLAAVGGTLKGVGAAVAAPPSSGTGAPRSSAPVQTSIPGTMAAREVAPIQIFVSVDEAPWDRPTAQERYKNFKRWAEQMGRSTGVRGG